MRLIDAEKVGCGMAETWQRVIVGLEVDKTPTIDPEALPIVRQLREELARVTAERDAILRDMEEIMFIGGGNMDTCRYCKNGKCTGRGGRELCSPKWRGPQKEE